MKKHILLLAIMLLPMVAGAYDAYIDGIYYSLNKEAKTATVTYAAGYSNYNQNAYTGKVNIPATVNYNGDVYNVTSIGYGAFQGCSGLTSVTIPNSVTSIGGDAFDGTGWYNNQSDGILYLENWLIGYKGEKPMGKLVIAEGTRGLAEDAFSGCSGLTSVTIPNSVTRIGSATFNSCSGLTAVHISDIAAWCKISFGNNPLYYAHHLYLGEEEIKDLVIPNIVTSIGGGAFSYCSGLTSVTIPNSVTSIGSSAFSGCSGLTSVTIPNSVTSIGGFAFYGCSGLTSVTIPNSVTVLKVGTFYGCSGLTTVTIPNSVISIEDGDYSSSYCGVFKNCSGLTSVTIPNSVTSIGRNAFQGCSGLTSVTIPNSVTSIGYEVFSGCSGLRSVTIPNSVTSIGDFAFYGCSGLTSVTIPNSVTIIGGGTFLGCSKLSSIYISDLSWWCGFTNRPTFPNPYHLFHDEVEVKNLVIPGDVTTIGKNTFYGCAYITSITIPGSVIFIDENAFQGCSNVETLHLREGLQIIRRSAFNGCRSLKSLTLPSTVEFIYQEAFANCYGLESVKALPETPPFLYDNSFSNYNIPLYASKTAVEAYKTTSPWSKFAQFLTLDGTEVEVPQCATPTVAYQDGQLMLDCETDGAECVWTLRNPDTLSGHGKTIELARQYELTVYATAKGYTDSAPITYYIVWGNKEMEGDNVIRIGGATADVNKDGVVDVADIATIISTMAGKK